MIELLIVISIIGVLASLVMVSYSTSQKQARDTVRKSDLRQYSSSLENYANKTNGLYPTHTDATGVDASGTLCDDLGLTDCPEDPRNDLDSTRIYSYQSDSLKYTLWSLLENSDNYWVVCSTGKSGVITTSGFSVSGGICPL